MNLYVDNMDLKEIQMNEEEMFGKYPVVTFVFSVIDNNGIEIDFKICIPMQEPDWKKVEKFVRKYEIIGNRWYERDPLKPFK